MKKIQLKLKAKDSLDKKLYNLSVYLNGWLMEKLEPSYVDYLHHSEAIVYSQCVYKVEDLFIWEINILDEEKGREIISLLEASDLPDISIKAYDNQTFEVVDCFVSVLNKKNLADCFYRTKDAKEIHLNFLSPTSFRQNKSYVFFPDTRLILQSCLMRYQRIFESEKEINEEFLQELCDSMQVKSYNIRSTSMKIHNYYIPGFQGKMRYRLIGNTTVNNYIRMLFAFAEFSGVGIKTALGMGKLSVSENKRDAYE